MTLVEESSSYCRILLSEHSNGVKDFPLAIALAELLIGHKIGPVHSLNGCDGIGIKAIDVDLAETPHL